VVTGSHDTTIKLWDLAAGRSPLKSRSNFIPSSSLWAIPTKYYLLEVWNWMGFFFSMKYQFYASWMYLILDLLHIVTYAVNEPDYVMSLVFPGNLCRQVHVYTDIS
jgi:hypothetical protein